MAIIDLQKRISEGEGRLKQQQNLYEAVRADRNLYSKNLIEAQVRRLVWGVAGRWCLENGSLGRCRHILIFTTPQQGLWKRAGGGGKDKALRRGVAGGRRAERQCLCSCNTPCYACLPLRCCCCVSPDSCLQDEIQEMKRKFKIMQHQIEQLKEEISAKDLALVKEHFDHMKVRSSCRLPRWLKMDGWIILLSTGRQKWHKRPPLQPMGLTAERKRFRCFAVQRACHFL